LEKNKRSKKEASASPNSNSSRLHDEDEDNEDEDDEDEDDEDEEEEADGDEDLSELGTGQVMKIYVQDFMCHSKLTVKFGRRINLITGANGSGNKGRPFFISDHWFMSFYIFQHM
jgi:hypothetical protein